MSHQTSNFYASEDESKNVGFNSMGDMNVFIPRQPGIVYTTTKLKDITVDGDLTTDRDTTIIFGNSYIAGDVIGTTNNQFLIVGSNVKIQGKIKNFKEVTLM